MYLYMLTSISYKTSYIAKLGCTECPYSRLQNFLTSYPPGNEVDFEGIWETTAISKEELFDLEERLHFRFHKYRMKRERPGDSEWFDFKTPEVYSQVSDFLKSQSWIKQKVKMPPRLPSKYLNKNYYPNLNYIKSDDTRIKALQELQRPIIDKITEFLSTDLKAGIVISPCGSGKTRMTSEAISNLQRVVICCPSTQIQEQWKATLKQSNATLIGCNGTTSEELIKSIFEKDSYCIITTYMSSHLLLDYINDKTQLLVLDEAHHLSGIITEEDEGEGRTRKLMMKATELNIKRLSLTFTPRFVESEDSHISMDDVGVFGNQIAEMKLRTMIDKGVLPDYRIWTMRDTGQKAQGIFAKAEAILQGWNATEVYREEERYILNHLIIFASSLDEVDKLKVYFNNKTSDTILTAKGGDDLQSIIKEFNDSPRAILINCLVLGEGVDIPICDSVCITYPKKSRGQITQMVLRAGRWCEGKNLFHILIPMFQDEDYEGFEEVLYSLASCDDQIKDEIILRSSKGSGSNVSLNNTSCEIAPECIIIDDYDGSNIEDLQKCFGNIRKALITSKDAKKIQKFCEDNNITTSVDYNVLRQTYTELPEDPRPRKTTWYDFLNYKQIEKLSVNDFVKNVIEKNRLNLSSDYDDWRLEQTCPYPSIQNILDGYFGEQFLSLSEIISKLLPKQIKRRR